MALAVILICCGTTVIFTSCSDNDDNTISEIPTVKPAETPTEDALSATTDKAYATYGEWDEEFGHALARRLKGAKVPATEADIYVIDPTDADNLDFVNNEDLKTIIRRTASGEAALVLTKATYREFYDWAQLYVLGFLLIDAEDYMGDGYDSPQAAPARRVIANAVRNAYMAGHKRGMQTRATTVNGMELDWEHVTSWPEEEQNAIMFDGYALSGDNELFVMNAAVTLDDDEDDEEQQPQTDYEWGQKADAVVNWLNRQGKDDAKARAGLADFSRAVTRAGGSDISDIMSAQTKDFVFDYEYYRAGNSVMLEIVGRTEFSAINVQYRVYSAYDFAGNTEYYQVRQNITVLNDRIHTTLNGDEWVNITRDDIWWFIDTTVYGYARQAWMKRIDTKMWLEGNGTKSIVAAAPMNENGNTASTSSSGGSHTTTFETVDGYSIGISAGMSGLEPALSMSYNLTHTDTYTDSKTSTWNNSTSWNTMDLSTTLTLGNDENATVNWVHNGNIPTGSAHVNWTTDPPVENITSSSNIKTLLKSTCVTDENVLWKVKNPSGSYTLNTSLNVVNEMGKVDRNYGSQLKFYVKDNQHEISFVLNTPDRFKRKWNNVIYDYGSVNGNIQMTHYLDEYIESAYGRNSANFCWASLFVSTEATADGSANARDVFQTFKNSIKGMKRQLVTKGFAGRLVFGLKLDGQEDLLDSVVLNLDE